MGYDGELPIAVSADVLEDEIRLGTPSQREELLVRLGVNPAIAREASSTPQETTIKVDPLDRANTRLLFVSCGSSSTAHLFLLLHTTSGWHVSEDLPLDCWSENVSYQPLLVPGQGGQAVLVHRVNHGHGSGYLQDDLILFGARGRRLVNLLETSEHKVEDTGEQTSTLQPFPDGSIEETRATYKSGLDERKKRLIGVERRRWTWSSSAERFEAGSFHDVK